MVVVTLQMDRTKKQLIDEWGPDAPEIAKLPGMRWKFWSFDEASRSYAGVYLFDGMAAARAFLDGPAMASVHGDPKVKGVRAQAYEVLTELSATTRAPLTPSR